MGLKCMDTKALHCFAGRQTHNMERDNNITKQQVLDQNKSTLQIFTLFQTVFTCIGFLTKNDNGV